MITIKQILPRWKHPGELAFALTTTNFKVLPDVEGFFKVFFPDMLNEHDLSDLSAYLETKQKEFLPILEKFKESGPVGETYLLAEKHIKGMHLWYPVLESVESIFDLAELKNKRQLGHEANEGIEDILVGVAYWDAFHGFNDGALKFCLNCEEPFLVPPSQGPQKKYCSNRCRSAHYRKKQGTNGNKTN